MIALSSELAGLQRDGYALIQGVYSAGEVAELRRLLLPKENAENAPGRRLFGTAWVEVRDNALSAGLINMISQAFACEGITNSGDIRCIRATLFDKTAEANWKVPWHQDLTIPLEQMPEDASAFPGYGPWTLKDGIPHVQPSVAVLGRMLAARIHLDPCGADNGALRVLAGSHRHGRLDAAAIKTWRGNVDALVDCVANMGDVLLMHPLLLHASSPATHPARRRVLHLEFAACDLPAPLQWRQF